MHRLLGLIIRYPRPTLLVTALLVLLGLLSIPRMAVDLFPPLSIPVINVVCHYPGAAPEEMDLLVTRPVADELRSMVGVKRVASISSQGFSQVTVEFTWGTTLAEARQLVQARLSRVRGRLPAGVEPRLESLGMTLQEVAGYLFLGGGDQEELRRRIQYDVAGRLMEVPGVSSVEVVGGQRKAFWVTLRPHELASHHLTLEGVAGAIRSRNMGGVAGFIGESGKEYLIRNNGRISTLAQLGSLPVGEGPHGPVLLREVARIREGRAPAHYVVHGNGRPAVAILVRKQPGVNTIQVVKEVDAALVRLRPLLPSGVTVKKFYDQSEIILESRHEVLQDLILGGLLAVMVLYLFLGHGAPTFIVALTIPVTLLVTILVMHLWGLGFNTITMTALALAVGMLVDDSIVVAENIHRHRRRGDDAVDATVAGTAEIAVPDATGTFTTVAVFLPLLLSTGLLSIFLRPFGVTITAALLCSLLLSLTLVPLLFSRWTAGMEMDHAPWGRRLLLFLDRAVGRALRFCLRRKPLVAALALLSAGAAVAGALSLKATLLPPIDEGALLVEYVMPPGTSLRESDRIGRLVEKIAMTQPGVACVYRRTGSPQRGYQVEGVNKGEMLIKLRPKGSRKRTAWEIMAALRGAYSRIPGVVFLYHQPTQEKIDESFSGLPALFGVTIYGANGDELIRLAGEVERILNGDRAVSNVVNNTKIKAAEVEVRPDYSRMALYHIGPRELMDSLRAAHWGLEVTRIIGEKRAIPVMIRLKGPYPTDRGHIGELLLATSKGELVPLRKVAHIAIRHIPWAITRINGQREVTLVAEVEGDIPAVVRRLSSRFGKLHLPPGYRIEFSGQYRLLMESLREMGMALGAGILLIYLIMAMEFGSWLQPLIILVTIPMAGVGAVLSLLLTGRGFDLSVGMGAVTLAGIAVNNAIVLLDYANHRRSMGIPWEDALLQAASVRLRPILLTALTTMAALIPAAVGGTVGSRIFQPFAITVIGGLLSAMVATLLVVPTMDAWRAHRSVSKGG